VYLPLDQLGELLADQGECAFVTQRAGLQSLPVAPSVAGAACADVQPYGQ
jgi:hypothetical protein